MNIVQEALKSMIGKSDVIFTSNSYSSDILCETFRSKRDVQKIQCNILFHVIILGRCVPNNFERLS